MLIVIFVVTDIISYTSNIYFIPTINILVINIRRRIMKNDSQQ